MRLLEQGLSRVRQEGHPHEWLWRLVIDHGYDYTEIQPQIKAAFKYWDDYVKKSPKNYQNRKS